MTSKIDKRYIPTVIKTNTPMMLLQLAWKCPNCGGRAEESICTCDQTDQVTKNFVAAYSQRRWCSICMEKSKQRIIGEAKVTFMPEKQFTRWARGVPEKTPQDKRLPEG